MTRKGINEQFGRHDLLLWLLLLAAVLCWCVLMRCHRKRRSVVTSSTAAATASGTLLPCRRRRRRNGIGIGIAGPRSAGLVFIPHARHRPTPKSGLGVRLAALRLGVSIRPPLHAAAAGSILLGEAVELPGPGHDAPTPASVSASVPRWVLFGVVHVWLAGLRGFVLFVGLQQKITVMRKIPRDTSYVARTGYICNAVAVA
mmetsp:Transcript_13406/g.38258  ORF Transcript_13406/g.38258 Transcript_13406/m.38258 type:complete len:201 (-) Transcript_13406:119-721(-)